MMDPALRGPIPAGAQRARLACDRADRKNQKKNQGLQDGFVGLSRSFLTYLWVQIEREKEMLNQQVKDMACFFADLDSHSSAGWEVAYRKYKKWIIDGEFDPYANTFDCYERLGFIFAVFHEFEDRWLAQSAWMDGVDHPDGDEVFVFEVLDSIRKAALRRIHGPEVDTEAWNYFAEG